MRAEVKNGDRDKKYLIDERLQEEHMQKEKIILGNGVETDNDSDSTQLNNNIVIVGPSGCGKTMSYAEARLLETNESSMIVAVSKRRLVEKYKLMFEKRGYQVLDLNFADPENSEVAYDPMAYVKKESDMVYLAESIVYANPKKRENSKDPYWDQAAVSLLTALIACVHETVAEPDFVTVLNGLSNLGITEGLDGTIATTLDDTFAKLKKKNAHSLACTAWQTFCNCPVRTAGCILSALNTTLDTIFTSELKSMIRDKRAVDFETLGSRKTVLFVTTSAVNQSLHCFANMFYGNAIKELFQYAEKLPSGELPVPVHMLCDDFACGSRILNFPEMISIFREKRISVSILIQSESQLASMYGDNDAVTILNNCDRYVYMGGMDLRTCKNISERVNLPLDEVLYLPVCEEYVFQRGQRPVKTKRYNIRENRQYQKVTEEYERLLADQKCFQEADEAECSCDTWDIW